MLLRRLTKHVAEQSWFAVWLDLIVVVVGIFLGLQAAQWNDARQDVQWEQEFLRDLKGDLERDFQHLETVLAFQSAKGDRLRAAMQQLVNGNGLTDADYWSAKEGNSTFFPANGVYESALTSGKIELIRDRPLRYQIMNLYGHHYTRVTYNGELYDARVETTAWESRKYFDVFQHKFVRWDESVEQDVRAEFAFLILENEIYVDLVQTLAEQISVLVSDLDSR
jgi:hypothetical protein